jgi:hypothetical protein
MSGSINLIAGGDIRPMRFVKITGNNTGAEADANERIVGISNRTSRRFDDSLNAASGDPIQLRVEGEEAFLELGGSVSAGGEIKSDADGKGVAIATTGTTIQETGAIAIEGGASGEIIKVRVFRASRRPALT